ncbi:MAG: hypothetical protein RJA98_1397 [Pseudomonadota bacterium]|jgi:uncharacterized protein (DUF4213/DUF364 family)
MTSPAPSPSPVEQLIEWQVYVRELEQWTAEAADGPEKQRLMGELDSAQKVATCLVNHSLNFKLETRAAVKRLKI